jgi:GT2 family glycosyltransferase
MISVVIVNYKVPHLLKNCVDALKKIDRRESIQIIIVDNDSGDDSKKIITLKHPDVTWIQNSKNEGFSKAVNRGMEKAEGEFILLLNPDTEIYPGSVNACEKFFDSHPDAGIIGGKVLNPDGSVQPQCRRKIPNPGSAFFRLFGLTKLFPGHHLAGDYELPLVNLDNVHEVEAVSGALMCIRKDLMLKLNGMDGNFFLYGEDLDICYRTTEAGFKIYFHPEVVAVHHRGASRKKRPFRTLWYIHQAMVHFYSKHQASGHTIFTNLIIYTAIWLRWIGMSMYEIAVKVTGKRMFS